MHVGQVNVTVDTVRELVEAQFPRWRGLPITRVGVHGTVHSIFRIGRGWVARFPLRGDNADLVREHLESEADAARELFGRTRFATPEPVAIGAPGAGYPLPWSVQTWVPGVPATGVESAAVAEDLAEFILGVRAVDARGRTFAGHGRGGVLASHADWVRLCLERSEHLVDVPRLRRLWHGLRDLPRGDGPDVMCHGDLIPGNVLVADGRIAGLIDVGGLGAADPALDLVGAWHLFDAGPRQVLRDRLGCDDLEWQRGKAWALEQALGTIWYYVDTNPPMSSMGLRTVERLLADA